MIILINVIISFLLNAYVNHTTMLTIEPRMVNTL